jgi:response regulator RpfG family c-di-GMP phosphodiesterase
MAEPKIKVLYVDDEMNNLVSFKATFRMKYDVLTAVSGEEAVKLLEKTAVDVIVTDQRMPGMTGVQFLESILDKYPEPMRVLLTGYADLNAVIDAVNKGKIFHYLSKPWNEDELGATIERAYGVFKKRKEEQELNEKLMLSNDQLEFMLRQSLLS